MKLKQTVAAVALGLGFTAFAQANYIDDLGVLSFDNPLSVQGATGSASGNFSDWFTFTVASDVLAADATALVVLFNGGPNFNVEGLEIAVYKGFYTDNSFNGLSSYELLDSFNVTGSGATVSGVFNFDSQWSEYTFLISGKSTGGSDIYSFGMTAAAVPEPAEYAMLLAGLGIVGMAARRRKMKMD